MKASALIALYVFFNSLFANAPLDTAIIGEWTNVTYLAAVCGSTDKMNSAFLRYSFREDGTYTLNYGNRQHETEETGIWGMSKDGNYVVLNVKETGETRLLKIASLDEHSLQLENFTNTGDFGKYFCTNQKSFTFVK